jgi:hypothetical protein
VQQVFREKQAGENRPRGAELLLRELCDLALSPNRSGGLLGKRCCSVLLDTHGPPPTTTHRRLQTTEESPRLHGELLDITGHVCYGIRNLTTDEREDNRKPIYGNACRACASIGLLFHWDFSQVMPTNHSWLAVRWHNMSDNCTVEPAASRKPCLGVHAAIWTFWTPLTVVLIYQPSASRKKHSAVSSIPPSSSIRQGEPIASCY